MTNKTGKSVGIGLAWLEMTKVLQNDQQFIQEIKYGRKYGQAFSVY